MESGEVKKTSGTAEMSHFGTISTAGWTATRALRLLHLVGPIVERNSQPSRFPLYAKTQQRSWQ